MKAGCPWCTLVLVVLCCVWFALSSCSNHSTSTDTQSSILSDSGAFSLQVYGCYPNPFSDSTRLAYYLGRNVEQVVISVFNSSMYALQRYQVRSRDSALAQDFSFDRHPCNRGLVVARFNGGSTLAIPTHGVFYIKIEAQLSLERISQTITCMRN